MSSWSDRAVREVRPAEAVEHVLRYAAVAPMIAAAPQWVDLGCGDGTAAAAAGVSAETSLLVDRDPVEAARVLGGEALALDLASPEPLRDAIADDAVVTCFATIEHLDPWLPLVELLGSLELVTVVLSVPNQAFEGSGAWGEGAFEELQRLVPADAVVARQVALSGSALVVDDAAPALEPPSGFDQPPTDFVVAFGPRCAQLGSVASVEALDRRGSLLRDRERDAEVALLEARLSS